MRGGVAAGGWAGEEPPPPARQWPRPRGQPAAASRMPTRWAVPRESPRSPGPRDLDGPRMGCRRPRESLPPRGLGSWDHLHGVETGTQAPGHAVKSGLDSARADAHDLGHLDRRQVEHKVEVQKQAVLVGQVIERLAQVDTRCEVLLAQRPLQRFGKTKDRTPAATP